MLKTREELERIANERWQAVCDSSSPKREELRDALRFDLQLELVCQLADLNEALREPQKRAAATSQYIKEAFGNTGDRLPKTNPDTLRRG